MAILLCEVSLNKEREGERGRERDEATAAVELLVYVHIRSLQNATLAEARGLFSLGFQQKKCLNPIFFLRRGAKREILNGAPFSYRNRTPHLYIYFSVTVHQMAIKGISGINIGSSAPDWPGMVQKHSDTSTTLKNMLIG